MAPFAAMILGSVVRTVMAGAGGVVAAQGVQAEDDIQALTGAVTVIITFIWSAIQKHRAAKTASSGM